MKLKDKRVLLGITGSAAAFKGVALASLMRKRGILVEGIITKAGSRFCRPTQLSCVTGRHVYDSLFTRQPDDPVPHITLTENIDLMAVVPATADFMARAAHGLAPDLLTAAFLACDAPVLMAPSMNSRMWSNSATEENVRILSERGVIFAGPVSGKLACGTEGMGRMEEPEEVLKVCLKLLKEE